MRLLLERVGRLITPGAPPGQGMAVLIEDGLVAKVGPSGSLTPAGEVLVYDCRGALLTPGLIDSHTHPLYAHPRLAEIAARTRGASYAEIAAGGGGINATVLDTRQAGWAELELGLRNRLRQWLRLGTTTVEVKTGYWLNRDGELGAVELFHKLAAQRDLPDLTVTFLGAHALPPEYQGRRQEFVEEVAGWTAEAYARGAGFCDVFCDEGAFTVAESAHILGAARAAGMRLRIHADELALTGATDLAVELGAHSADHLLAIGDSEVAALAGSSTVATLCPVTALAMGRTPPARALAAAGVTVALGTDHNPGTSGATSMSLIVWLAVTELGLSVDQALSAATAGGARSLGLADRGRVEPGLVADLVLWDADHEGAFAWRPDLEPLQVWRQGVPVSAASPG
ncbi:MAG: imidazolonepropionase [Candidatus Dormibacteria bacterium]